MVDVSPLRSSLVSRLATLLTSTLAILIPIIGALILLARQLHMPLVDVWWIIYGAFVVFELAWFIFMIGRRTRKRYKEVPLQTTELGLSASHINIHSRYIHGGCVKTSMRWQDISSIRCIQRIPDRFLSLIERVDPQAQGNYLQLLDMHGKKIDLQLDCIQTIEERQILRDFILQFVPQIDIKDVLSSLLRVGKVDNVPFTKLWSQALQDARPRLHTAPLVQDTVLQNGRFVIKDCIGSGGQGAVYLSDMRELEDTLQVVLKEYVLPDLVHASEHKAAVEQFEKEVRLLSKISHPGVIKMYDAFVEDHRAYLVLEHVDGISLRDHVQRFGPMESGRAVAIAQQMCDILHSLHSMQPTIMHLDFSPENILISGNDLITVIDFNISVEENSLRTRTVMGKQRYMAPEQYRGKPTVRSDVYSMGATLFFLLTGKEPEPISVSRPSRENPQINSQLENIVVQATALEEEKRFQSAASLKEALLAVAMEHDVLNTATVDDGQKINTSITEQCRTNLRN